MLHTVFSITKHKSKNTGDQPGNGTLAFDIHLRSSFTETSPGRDPGAAAGQPVSNDTVGVSSFML